MANARVTQSGTLVEINQDPNPRVTQTGVLIEINQDPNPRITQAGVLIECHVPWPASGRSFYVIAG